MCHNLPISLYTNIYACVCVCVCVGNDGMCVFVDRRCVWIDCVCVCHASLCVPKVDVACRRSLSLCCLFFDRGDAEPPPCQDTSVKRL